MMLNIIREMQVKMTKTYFSHTWMAIIKKTYSKSCWQGCEEIGTLMDYQQDHEIVCVAIVENSFSKS